MQPDRVPLRGPRRGFAQKTCPGSDFLGNWHFCPKSRRDPKFIHRLNQAADIVTEDFTQDLIPLGNGSLGAYCVAKLPFNHRESGLYVRALMVMPQERIAIELIEVIQPSPEFRSFACGIDLKRNVRRCPCGGYYGKVPATAVLLISRHVFDVEAGGCGVDQRRKVGRIICVALGDFYAGDYVRLDAYHEVGFHPLALTA